MKLIQIQEAADRLGVSRQTMTNWGKSGAIRLRKMGKTSTAYWVDADTIDAMADTMADIENTRKMLTQEQEEIRKQYRKEHETLRDLARELFMLKKFGTGLMNKEFYMGIPIMLRDLDMISERETTIMRRIIGGDDLGYVAEDYGLTRERVSQIFFKGCRKARKLEDLKAIIDEAKKAQSELEYLRKKEKVDSDYIQELEEKLAIEHKPQEERDRNLMMKRLVEYDLSVRTLNCLKSVNIETIGDLLQLNRKTLLQCRNFGKKSLTELDDLLESIGREWGTKYLVPVYNDRGYFVGYRLSDTPERL